MIAELRNIVSDLRSGKSVEIYVLAALALLVAVLDIFGVVSQPVTDATILGVMAVLLYGRILDRRRSEGQIRGIREFHPDRTTIPQLHLTLPKAQHEILMIGVALTSIVQNQRVLLENVARKGRMVKIAVWLPPLEEAKRVLLIEKLEDLIDVPDLERNIPGNIERLKHWYSSLDATVQHNIEIRGYSSFPTLSIVFIDKDEPNGYVHVEPIVFRAPPEELPSFRLGPHDSPALFARLRKRYEKLWDESVSLVE